MSVWICTLILMGIARANGWTVPLWCGLVWGAMTGIDLLFRLTEAFREIKENRE